jgi:Cysteine-rich CPCC
MIRSEAIDLLVKQDLVHLSSMARESMLIDWWSIDTEDAEYEKLPKALKHELRRTEHPDDPMRAIFDPLLKIALRHSYVGVVNSFLESRLTAIGIHERVDGLVEMLEACPCCGYRSLRERGAYGICRVCFWEDDGTEELGRVSSPNGMSLQEARVNFQSYGAVAEKDRRHVLADGKERFVRSGV